jgi:hypothetical protein
MTYPNGTPTPDDHRVEALEKIEALPEEAAALSSAESAVIDALRGLTHAVLAVAGELEALREARP